MNSMKATILAAGTAALFAVAHSGGLPHWGYSGDKGPKHWAELSPQYSACSGKNQAPINLTEFIEADLEPLEFAYRAGGDEISNNGHTVQVSYEAGNTIGVDGQTFHLVQFHFHAPSENHVNGESFPMEAHLVHADKDGNLAVVAVLFTQGKANAALAEAWAKMPQHAGDKHTFSSPIDASDPAACCPRLLPFQRLADDAPLHRGRPLAGDETPGFRVKRTNRKVRPHHTPSQQPPDSGDQRTGCVAVRRPTLKKAISLFSGAGGMDIGIRDAGFHILAEIELDEHCCATLEANRQKDDAEVIQADIQNIDSQTLAKKFSLKKGGLDLLLAAHRASHFLWLANNSGYGMNGACFSLK